MYRRPASNYKRSTYTQNSEEALNLPLTIQEEDIPMPNEEDIPPIPDTAPSEGLNPFRFLGKNFYIDDLILIGLLIILIHEKVQDEILLIVIAYILLF